MSNIFERERELNELIATGQDDLMELENMTQFENEHHSRQVELAIQDLRQHIFQWELERLEVERLISLYPG